MCEAEVMALFMVELPVARVDHTPGPLSVTSTCCEVGRFVTRTLAGTPTGVAVLVTDDGLAVVGVPAVAGESAPVGAGLCGPPVHAASTIIEATTATAPLLRASGTTRRSCAARRADVIAQEVTCGGLELRRVSMEWPPKGG
jgi:hypothetical protein